MRHFLSNTVPPLPNLSWGPLTEQNGWRRAVIYSSDSEIASFGPLPTTAMVLHVMENRGYTPLADDMPEGWSKELRPNLTIREVTRLFELKGNQVAAACKNSTLKASIDVEGNYFIDEGMAAEWYLFRQRGKKVSKNKKTGKECLRCGRQMVKDGVGNAPLVCRDCGYPRRP